MKEYLIAQRQFIYLWQGWFDFICLLFALIGQFAGLHLLLPEPLEPLSIPPCVILIAKSQHILSCQALLKMIFTKIKY